MKAALADYRVSFTVHGRCPQAYAKRRVEQMLDRPGEGSLIERARALREEVMGGGVTIPVEPLSAPFDTRQRAEQYAELARNRGVADVSIVPTFKQLDHETGRWRKAKSVPAEIMAMASR